MPALASAKELKAFKEQHKGVEINVEERKEVQPVSFALGNVKTTIAAIEGVVGEFSRFYLTGRHNFREQIATLLPYKGQRSEFDRPTHYQAIRTYLEEVWKAEVVHNQEADDAIGIEATRINSQEGNKEAAVIVSIDKDLDMIEGFHYNWVNGAKYKISKDQALRNFYKQMLVGDRVDNIPGVKGVGDVTAERILGDATKESALFDIVRNYYHKTYPKGYELDGKVVDVDKALLEIGQLLYIRKQEGEIWQFPHRR